MLLASESASTRIWPPAVVRMLVLMLSVDFSVMVPVLQEVREGVALLEALGLKKP